MALVASPIRMMRTNAIQELGYELHIDNENCVPVYKKVMDIGKKYGLKNAGFRTFNSLNCEAGNNQYQKKYSIQMQYNLTAIYFRTSFMGL